jgi:hypothetical protein
VFSSFLAVYQNRVHGIMIITPAVLTRCHPSRANSARLVHPQHEIPRFGYHSYVFLGVFLGVIF